MEDSPLPDFNNLLTEVYLALFEVDMYDLHSEDPESVKVWNRLNEEYSESAIKLVRFIVENAETITKMLSTHLKE